MSDERLIRDLRALDTPVEPDAELADRLFARLLDARRPRRRRMPIVLLAAALLVAASAVAVTMSGGAPRRSEPRIAVAPMSEPATSPPSASPTPRAVAPVQGTWTVPTSSGLIQLEYTIPAGLDLAVHDVGSSVAFTPAGQPLPSPDEPSRSLPPTAHGVTVADVTGATYHYSNGRPIGLDAHAFLQGLGTHLILTVDLGEISATTVGARDAWTADVLGTQPDAHLDKDGVIIDLWPHSRLTTVDVGGQIVLIQVWATTADGLESWLPRAEELVDTFRLVAGP